MNIRTKLEAQHNRFKTSIINPSLSLSDSYLQCKIQRKSPSRTKNWYTMTYVWDKNLKSNLRFYYFLPHYLQKIISWKRALSFNQCKECRNVSVRQLRIKLIASLIYRSALNPRHWNPVSQSSTPSLRHPQPLFIIDKGNSLHRGSSAFG